jgi:hypothetical protein
MSYKLQHADNKIVSKCGTAIPAFIAKIMGMCRRNMQRLKM